MLWKEFMMWVLLVFTGFCKSDVIMKANVLVVVAGMEGALASVVSGLVDRPVIAVPPVLATEQVLKDYLLSYYVK